MGQKRNEIYDKAYECYLLGLSISQVAEELKVTRQSVFTAFKRRGFTLRSPNFKPEQVFNDLKFTLRNNGYFALTTNDRMLMHRYVWEYHNGEIPEGMEIHHKNRNKADNRIENLEMLSKSDHARLYSTGSNQHIIRDRPFRRDRGVLPGSGMGRD